MSNNITTNILIGDQSNKLLVFGDFYLHVNDPSDEDAGNFSYMISTLGLDEQISFSTHRAGNNLDLAFTEVVSDLVMGNNIPGS